MTSTLHSAKGCRCRLLFPPVPQTGVMVTAASAGLSSSAGISIASVGDNRDNGYNVINGDNGAAAALSQCPGSYVKYPPGKSCTLNTDTGRKNCSNALEPSDGAYRLPLPQ